jgi:hypothetical protein
MTQATTFSVPTTGPASPDVMAGRIDDNFRAALSGHSGASRPSYAVAGTVWEDTATAGLTKFYLYDGTDDILLYTADTANNRATSAAEPWVDVATASTIDFGAVTSSNIRLTGTTTVTAGGTAPSGTKRTCRAAADFQLTHNGTSFILLGGANIAVKAGDIFDLVSLGSGNWLMVKFTRSDGTMFHSSQASTSGTAISFQSIPADASVIQIGIAAVSTSGTSPVCVQLGTSSGYVTTGYTSVADAVNATPGVNSYTAGFAIEDASVATTVRTATVWLTKVTGNTWIMSSSGINDSPGLITGGGTITLAGTLDRVQVTTIGGANTFDAGNVSVMVVR